MQASMAPIPNCWINLSTVTAFDKGNYSRTTARLNNSMQIQNADQIVQPVPFSTSLLIESLIQQLCIIFEGNKSHRNKLFLAICDKLHELKLIDSSYSMVEFETLRGQYQHVLYHLVAVARASLGNDTVVHIPRCLTTDWSRYHREFQEISFIAAGGFGNVFKALHRLDGIEYAIKKIVVRSKRIKSIVQHLEEVKTLAKLNHTNIISYKCAWIEPTFPQTVVHALPYTDNRKYSNNVKVSEDNSCDNCSLSNSEGSRTNPSNNDIDGNHVLPKARKLEESEENSNKNLIAYQDTCSNSISFRNNSRVSKIYNTCTDDNTNYSGDANDSSTDADGKRICNYIPQTGDGYVTLYIQMGLCEKTLYQWLEERTEPTPQSMVIGILSQIISGLHYIHSRSIVHHDVKPSNIFITTTGHLQIQLGDFGLACPLQRESHHSVMGTHMYAAPEQLEGKCDPKSDIYSVGIVLSELLVPTSTLMERCQLITNLRKGQIHTTLALEHPKLVQIVSQLVQTDPRRRPTTAQLLEDINEDKDMLIAQLRNSIIEKDHTIDMLRKKLSMLEAKIE